MLYVRFPLSLRNVEDLLLHVNAERSLSSRPDDKQTRTAALAEWRALCAGWRSAFLPRLRRVAFV